MLVKLVLLNGRLEEKFLYALATETQQPDAGKLKLWGTPKQGGKVIRYWSGEVRILASATIWSGDGRSIGK
jgi:hypothetical protein